MRAQLIVASLAALLLTGSCDDRGDTAADPELAASAQSSVVAAKPQGVVLPPVRPYDDNPLNLPAASVDVAKGATVFAVPKRILETAKMGSTLVLRAAKVVRNESNELVVRARHGVAYSIHGGYVVVPRPGRIGRGTPLIAAYRGVLRHAVAKNLSRDRVVIRFTDLGYKLRDQKLAPRDIGVLKKGVLMPGSYAVYRAEHDHQHVILVSQAVHADGKARWLVLAEGGESRLIEASKLSALPEARFRPRAGTPVLVAYRGSMVRAKVRTVDNPGVFTVKRERAGAPLTVGPGMMLKPQ
jgi:hypothetical protein